MTDHGFKEGATLTASVTDPWTAWRCPPVVYLADKINSAWTNIGTDQTHTIGFNDGGNNEQQSHTDGAGNAAQPVSFTLVDVNQPEP